MRHFTQGRWTPDADNTILGDTFARDLIGRIDYDWRKTGVTRRNASAGTVRSIQFDNWARQFLALHDRAVVLHLGCGLDDRVFRLDPGPDVEWYDVDYPDVIALVEQLYPVREHYHPVAASVTDPAWLNAIPADRPVLFIAEGLTYYLTRDDGVALLRRVVEHFPSGELHFDVSNWLGVKLQKINPVVRRSGSTLSWAVNGPGDILHAVPGVRLLATTAVFETDEFKQLPSGRYRALGKIDASCPDAARDFTTPPLRLRSSTRRMRSKQFVSTGELKLWSAPNFFHWVAT